MRRQRQLPECTRVFLDEVLSIVPEYELSAVETMVRNRDIRFKKTELKQIIEHLHEKFELLAPTKKNILPPSDVDYMRKYFMILIDKAESDPATFLSKYTNSVTKIPKRLGRPPGKSKPQILKADDSKKPESQLTTRNKRALEEKANILLGKRKVQDNSTDSEQETESSEQSGPLPPPVIKRRRRGKAAKTVDVEPQAAESSSYEESPETLLSYPDPSFQLFSTSPECTQLFPSEISAGKIGSGQKAAFSSVKPGSFATASSSVSSSGQYPPPLAIPPPASRDVLEQVPHVLRFHSLVDGSSLQAYSSSIDSSGIAFQMLSDQNSDYFDEFNDETLEILQTLLDSPHASPVGNTKAIQETSSNQDSRKIRICFRAKKALESWDWSPLKRYIQSHKEHFKFLRSFHDSEIDLYVNEFKRFLVLKVINDDVDDSKISSSVFIDRLWLCLMTMPTEYTNICNVLLGSSTSKTRLLERKTCRVLVDSDTTFAEYRYVNGSFPPPEFWDAKFVCPTKISASIRMSSEIQVRIRMSYSEDYIDTCKYEYKLRDTMFLFFEKRGVVKCAGVSVIFVFNGFRFTVNEIGEECTLGHLTSCRPLESSEILIHAFVMEDFQL